MKKRIIWMLAAILICGISSVQAQVMKVADLEKYAKERYGDKWLDAAKNLSKDLTLDKNESLSYQQIIEVPDKNSQQIYIALNYWATATLKTNRPLPSTTRRLVASSYLPPYITSSSTWVPLTNTR